MKNSLEQYDKIREQTEKAYSKIGKLFCPALKSEIIFNSDGLKHLMYKSNAKVERDKNNQLTKFKLFPIAKKIIEISTTFQEYDEMLVDVRVRHNKKPFTTETRCAKYWGLVAIITGTKVKTIIRQVGEGQKHFWSVIPNWNTNKHSNFVVIQKSAGNLEND